MYTWENHDWFELCIVLYTQRNMAIEPPLPVASGQKLDRKIRNFWIKALWFCRFYLFRGSETSLSQSKWENVAECSGAYKHKKKRIYLSACNRPTAHFKKSMNHFKQASTWLRLCMFIFIQCELKRYSDCDILAKMITAITLSRDWTLVLLLFFAQFAHFCE